MDDRMYKRQFEMTGLDGKVKVFAENYMNMMEIACVAKTREYNPHVSRHDDYLVDSTRSNNPAWNDFSTQRDLMDKMQFGVRDKKIVDSIQKYAHKATVEEKEKYSQKMLDVSGGGVNVPLLLSGSPICMYSRKKAPVKTKIINMGLHCHVTCDVSKEQYLHAGMLVAQLVSKLEKAGYRLRIDAVDPFYVRGSGRINLLTAVIKRENEPMNYARILFPTTSVSFLRGVAFGWCARNPDYLGDECLGTYAEYAFRHEEVASKFDEMFEKGTGLKGFTAFRMRDIIDMSRSKGDEMTMKYIESKLIESIR